MVSLKENHPEWAAEEIKILGVCTIYKPLANTKQENDRLTAAKNTATLLQPANLGWTQDLYFVKSKASYGWGGRDPPKKDANALFNILSQPRR